MIFKITIFGHETWPLARVPEVSHIVVLSFYLRGSKLSLFSLYGQRFLRYVVSLNMPYLGMKLEDPEVAHILCFYTVGGRGGGG